MAEPEKKKKLETTLVLSFAALLMVFNLLPNYYWENGAFGFPLPILSFGPAIKFTPFALPAIIIQLNALAIIWFIGFHRRRSLDRKTEVPKDDYAGCVTMFFVSSIPAVIGLELILWWLFGTPSGIIPDNWDILITWYLMSPAFFFLSLYLCSYHSRKPKLFPAHLHATWLITIAFLVFTSWGAGAFPFRLFLPYPLGIPSGIIVFWILIGIFHLFPKRKPRSLDASI